MNKWKCIKCRTCKHDFISHKEDFSASDFICDSCNCTNYVACGTEHIGNMPCECSVVKLPDISRRHDKPEKFGNHPEPLKHELAKEFTGGATNEEKKLASERTRNRKAIDELLDDKDFDTSLEASRRRLEMSVAIGSEMALRKSRNGLCSDGDAEFLQSVTSTYRILVNTQPQKDPSEMTDAELAKQAQK
jgi:hypothetical protein